jgi:hypothetical protein
MREMYRRSGQEKINIVRIGKMAGWSICSYITVVHRLISVYFKWLAKVEE